MITINPTQKTVRETRAPFEYEHEGRLETAQIRVRYYSATTKELKEDYEQAKIAIEEARKKNESAVFWNSETLARRLESLPDLVDQDGKPFEITLDFLESLDARNVGAIVKAIEEDQNPKSKAPISG